jgi:Mrp family chromosome partitioning ATPase
MKWIKRSDESQKICIVTSPKGSGKTVFASALAHALAKRNQLVGYFHCGMGPGDLSLSGSAAIRSLSYQAALRIPTCREKIIDGLALVQAKVTWYLNLDILLILFVAAASRHTF